MRVSEQEANDMRRGVFCEQTHKIWTELWLRGYVESCFDFPHQMDMPALEVAAQSIPDSIRVEVCCIPSDDYPYRHLAANAWANGYWAAVEASERNLTVFALTCRELPRDEVLADARDSCVGGVRDLIDEAWQAYCHGYDTTPCSPHQTADSNGKRPLTVSKDSEGLFVCLAKCIIG